MAIRAVVFDVGGVLEIVDDATWAETWVRRWEERAQVPAGQLAARLAHHEPDGKIVTGQVREAEFRRWYADALGLDEAAADEMMAEMWDGYCGELNVELRDFCASLRPRYRTGILSNSADGARREEQRRYGFEQLVDVIVYSHEVGIAKPDEAVYRLTERLLGARPHEILLIDDVEDNVEAAQACGWSAVLHRNTADTLALVQDALSPTGG